MTPRRGQRGTALAGAALALAFHGAVLAALFLGDPPAPPTPRRPPMRVTLATRPPAGRVPQPPPPSAAGRGLQPPPSPAAGRGLQPPPRPVARREAPRPPAPPPSPSSAPAPTPTAAPTPPSPRRTFSASLSATVAGGGVAVPVSSAGADVSAPVALADRPSPRPGAPRSDAPAGAVLPGSAAPVDLAAVTRLPELQGRLSEAEIRAAYPDDERRRGREADVRLQILVAESGRVREVRVVRSAGPAFDEAAARLVRTFRFKPATQGDRAVAVWIPWTYRFRLGVAE